MPRVEVSDPGGKGANMTRTTAAFLTAQLSFAALCHDASAQYGQIIPKVWTGMSAPGLGGGTLSSLEAPHINNARQLAFQGYSQSADKEGIWRNTNTVIEAVAVSGQAIAPQSPLAFHTFNFDPSISDSGVVAFGSVLSPNTPRHVGIWSGVPNALTKIAVNGDPAPGTGSLFSEFIVNAYPYERYWRVGINNAGDVLFAARFEDVLGDKAGWWLNYNSTPPAMAPIVFEGMSLPTTLQPPFGGGTTSELVEGFSHAVLNQGRQTAVVMSARVGPGQGTNVSALFRGNPVTQTLHDRFVFGYDSLIYPPGIRAQSYDSGPFLADNNSVALTWSIGDASTSYPTDIVVSPSGQYTIMSGQSDSPIGYPSVQDNGYALGSFSLSAPTPSTHDTGVYMRKPSPTGYYPNLWSALAGEGGFLLTSGNSCQPSSVVWGDFVSGNYVLMQSQNKVRQAIIVGNGREAGVDKDILYAVDMRDNCPCRRYVIIKEGDQLPAASGSPPLPSKTVSDIIVGHISNVAIRDSSGEGLGVINDCGVVCFLVVCTDGTQVICEWQFPLRADLDPTPPPAAPLNINDYVAFNNLFNLGDCRVDFDGDGVLTINDYVVFNSTFVAESSCVN